MKERKDTAWIFKTLFLITISGTIGGTLLATGVAWYFSRGIPKIITVADYRPLGVTQIIAFGDDIQIPKPVSTAGPSKKKDVLIGEFFTERRYLIPFEKIPERVIQAFISAEDDQFFSHSGINLASIIRASIANFKAGHVVQGGSTITQQVAKSLVLTSERSFVRKIKEVIVASRLESNLTKQQILYLYLNQIFLGHRAYGVQAAAKTYFRKDISELTVGEAALLAGLPQAPSKYSPLQNPKRAKERQLYVLRRMYENQYITQGQLTEESKAPLRIYYDDDVNKKFAANWVEQLRRYLLEKYGEKALYEEALTVIVPSSPELMSVAQKSLREGLEAVDRRMGYRGPIQTLRTTEDMERVLKDIRQDILERELGFQALLPEGSLDFKTALSLAGYGSESGILKPGKRYKAVVTSVNDARKSANVMIGAILAELPLEKMAWAHPAQDVPTARGEPTAVSRVLQKGDLIYVKIDEIQEKRVVVSLDQEPEVQGALFSLDATTGQVLAMEGGYDFSRSEFNRATQALRQPGSAFKPIIYSAAMEKGFTPASIIVDSPIVYEDADSGKWKPANFDEKFHGDTTFRQALIKSRNVPTIKLVQAVQVSKMIEYAKRIGMNSQFPQDLSISLGSGTTSLYDLTKTYALFPRFGRAVTPALLIKVIDRDGRILEENKPQPILLKNNVQAARNPGVGAANDNLAPGPVASIDPLLGVDAYPLAEDPAQVLDPRVAYVMTHLMKEVVTYGTGHEAKSLGRVAAGKTGTTNDFADAWFMGFTPHIVTGVWVGYDSQKTMGHGETGARAALPIWLNFMKEAVKPYPADDFVVPPGVVFASIDPQSGRLAAPNASNAIKEAFIEGTEPKETALRGRVNSDTGANSEFFKEDIE